MIKRVGGPLAAALLALSLAAAQAQTNRADDTVVATVNGEKVTYKEWQTRLEALRSTDFVISLAPLRLKGETAGRLAMQMLVDSKLLLQYAAKTSLLPSEAEVSQGLELAKQQPAYQQLLANKQITEDQLRAEVRTQRTLFNVATINQRVTPDEARQYYDQHPDQFGTPELWQFAILSVPDKPTADKAVAELKAGTAFASVVSKYSTDPATKNKGGVYDPLPANSPTIPEAIRTAVAKLNVGDYTPPIAGSVNPAQKQGFLIIRLVKKQQAAVRPFDQVIDMASRAALFQKVGGITGAEKKILDYRKTSTITITLPGYESLYADAK